MQTIRLDTKSCKAPARVSFGTAATLCGSGLAGLPGQDLDRAFVVINYLFALSAAFVLTRCGRAHEVRRVETVTVDSVFDWLQRSGRSTQLQFIR